MVSPAAASYFQFEADFVESLRCIPMQVRFKLDTCGIKLKLAQWSQFNAGDRQSLVDLPCTTATDIQAYREALVALIAQRTGEVAQTLAIDPSPDWCNPDTVPTSVVEKAAAEGMAIPHEQWATFTPIQRFALIKLSRSSHENRNFLPAYREFSNPGDDPRTTGRPDRAQS
jgi:hypothetical protein